MGVYLWQLFSRDLVVTKRFGWICRPTVAFNRSQGAKRSTSRMHAVIARAPRLQNLCCDFMFAKTGFH
jgi:hypothetical protein